MMPQLANAELRGLDVAPDARLVGRDEELALIENAVAALSLGRGGAIWIEGEPGIGKSALMLAALATAKRAGYQIYVARADESAARFPLRILLDALQIGPHSTDPGRAEVATLLWGAVSPDAVTAGDAVAAAAEHVMMLVDRLCASGPIVLAAGRALALLLDVYDPEATLTLPYLSDETALWLPDLVRLAFAGGRPEVAEAVGHACRVAAEEQAAPAMSAAARHCLALLADDPIGVASAADGYLDPPFPLWRGQALENAAVLYAEQGQHEAARAAYAEALGIFSSLDAAWDIVRADARLRPLGVRRGVRGPRRRPTSGWESITPTELKIASLVAAGHTNPDIAAELFLSRATVSTHISHILAKLDAHSRVDIAREFTNHGRVTASS